MSGRDFATRTSHPEDSSSASTRNASTAMAGRWQLRLTVRAHGLERNWTHPGRRTRWRGSLDVGAQSPWRSMTSSESFRSLIRSSALCSMSVRNGFKPQPSARMVPARQPACCGSWIPGSERLVSVIAVSAFGRVEAKLDAARRGRLAALSRLSCRWASATPLGWEFRAVDVHGREHRVSWPIEGDQGEPIGGGIGDACWQRSITGYCNLMTDWAVAEAESVTVAEDELSIEVRLIGLQPSDCEDARLSSRVADVAVRRVEPADGAELAVRTGTWPAAYA